MVEGGTVVEGGVSTSKQNVTVETLSGRGIRPYEGGITMLAELDHDIRIDPERGLGHRRGC